MIADPLMVLLVTCAGITVTELLCFVGRLVLRIVSGQVALVGIPLMVRLILFATVGVKLNSGLLHLHDGLELLNNIVR